MDLVVKCQLLVTHILLSYRAVCVELLVQQASLKQDLFGVEGL